RSSGGHSELPAAVLASHGYPTLSLAYFGEPGLPQELRSIPLEYFRGALRWLAARPGVDGRRLVVLGISRGGEAALLAGISFPDLVHGVITCTGGGPVVLGTAPGVSDSAWTLGGAAIPPRVGRPGRADRRPRAPVRRRDGRGHRLGGKRPGARPVGSRPSPQGRGREGL